MAGGVNGVRSGTVRLPCRQQLPTNDGQPNLSESATRHLDLGDHATRVDGALLEAPVREPLVALDEGQQEGRVGAEALEGRERDSQDDRIRDVGLGAGVAGVVLSILSEQPDLADHVVGVVGEPEHEVGRDDATVGDGEERVRRFTGVEQDIVLAERADLDIVGQRPAVGLGEALEQDVGAEHVANERARGVTISGIRQGGEQHGEDSSVGGFAAAFRQLWLHNLTETCPNGQLMWYTIQHYTYVEISRIISNQ